jgi:hypothetical protein
VHTFSVYVSGLRAARFAKRTRQDHKEAKMQKSKSAGALLQYSKYTASIYDENGTDRGPINISNAQDDEQACDLAKRRGVSWLEENGLKKATIQIYRNGHTLPVVLVHNQGLEDELGCIGRENAGRIRNRRHKILN